MEAPEYRRVALPPAVRAPPRTWYDSCSVDRQKYLSHPGILRGSPKMPYTSLRTRFLVTLITLLPALAVCHALSLASAHAWRASTNNAARSRPYASLPYSTGFESSRLGFWELHEFDPASRLLVTSANSPYEGTYHLTFDSDQKGTYARNAAYLFLNLNTDKYVYLEFMMKDFGDENNADDGIYFSNNGGGTFIKLFDIVPEEETNDVWKSYRINVTSRLRQAAIYPTSTSVISFQQYDNYSISTDGISLDNVKVYSSEEAVANNADDFIELVDTSVDGDTIFIPSDKTIDLTGITPVQISKAITIRGDRGENGSLGGIIKTDNLDAENGMLSLTSDNIVISGLRLDGPDTEVCRDSSDCRYGTPNSEGIRIDTTQMEVFNCELYGWSRAAIRAESGPDKDHRADVHIHDNYIHHNRRDGLGYGVVVYGGYALIEKNVFDDNRHAIAGSGNAGSGYEARYNLILDQNENYEHSIDMHGDDGDKGPAGEWMYIHHNVILYEGPAGVRIRNTPREEAIVEDNTFVHQYMATDIEIEADTFPYAIENCDNDECFGFENMTMSGNKNDEDHSSELAFCDLSGDAVTDVLLPAGRSWFISAGAQVVWAHLNASDALLAELACADFDGDEKADLFRAHDGYWYLSLGGTSEWGDESGTAGQPLNTSSIPLSDLRFGDFNGDGKTDVFHVASGGQWQVSFGGSTAWQTSWVDGTGTTRTFKSSGYGLSTFAFADFNGDRIIDIFHRKDDGTWEVSFGGTGSWTRSWTDASGVSHAFASSSTPLAELRFGDFDGDGIADVWRIADGGQWVVSFGATASWATSWTDADGTQRTFASSDADLDELHLGLFDDDRVTDILRVNGRKWDVSSGATESWVQTNGSFDGEI
ncbi:MAG: VCBS repeat-containing protein [Candidatus Schekmanbacteria bacterium]|nr:VCBS repeat-containing protein [Candidatus Schekmanbacteria bacterium]